MAIPSYDLSWAAVAPAGSVEPPAAIKAQGHIPFSPLPSEWLNWRWIGSAAWFECLAETFFDSSVSLPGSWTGIGEHLANGQHASINATGLSVTGGAQIAGNTDLQADLQVDGTITTDRDGTSTVEVGGFADVTVADSSTVSNTTTETAIYTKTIPAGDLRAGSVVRLKGLLKLLSYIVAASDSLTVRVRLGGVSGTILFSLTYVPTPSADSMSLDHQLVIRTAGASGTAQALTTLGRFIDGTSRESRDLTGIDTTTDLDLVVTAQWAAAHVNYQIAAGSLVLELGGKH